MITINLEDVGISIGEMQMPDNTKVKFMTFFDQQSGIKVNVPLGAEQSETIGHALIGSGRIMVPNGAEQAAVLAGASRGG